MKKKSVHKNKLISKKTTNNTNHKKAISTISEKENRTEKILIENFIALQKVIVNMTEKFGKIGTQIENLLNIFEDSAKALAKKEFDLSKEKEDHEKILEQINNILNQNKTIAQSLSLMHEINSGGNYEQEQEFEPNPIMTPPQEMMQQPPTFQPPMNQLPPELGYPPQNIGRGYQKSISSMPQNIPKKFMPQPNEYQGGQNAPQNF